MTRAAGANNMIGALRIRVTNIDLLRSFNLKCYIIFRQTLSSTWGTIAAPSVLSVVGLVTNVCIVKQKTNMITVISQPMFPTLPSAPIPPVIAKHGIANLLVTNSEQLDVEKCSTESFF